VSLHIKLSDRVQKVYLLYVSASCLKERKRRSLPCYDIHICWIL